MNFNGLILMIAIGYLSRSKPELFSIAALAPLATNGARQVAVVVKESSREFAYASRREEPARSATALGH